jgi:hypothetical protein
VFSFAGGIFHPYYVSLLAPFTAALIGAGVGQMRSGDRSARVIAPLAIGAGAITELVVLSRLDGSLAWARPVVIGVAGVGAVLLGLALSKRVRATVLALALLALLAAPAAWAAQTLGHATAGTFPTGGPASASSLGAGGFGRGGFGRRGGFGPGAFGGAGRSGGFGFRGFGGQGFRGRPPGFGGRSGLAGRPPGFGGRGGLGNNPFGGNSATLTAAERYVKTHGGGTIGVSSQSSAATAILSSDASVAGLGGFSGRESSVTAGWLAMEVKSGHLRWVLLDGTGGLRAPGDSRTGSQAAMDVAARACKRLTVDDRGAANLTIYDCQGRAAAILAAARGQ